VKNLESKKDEMKDKNTMIKGAFRNGTSCNWL